MVNSDIYISPQSREELEEARKNLEKELKEKNLTGVPSIDKPYRKYYDKALLDLEVPNMSMFEYLYECSKNNMNLNAINYFGKKVSYEEMFYNIEDTAKRFKKYGIKEHDYINLALPISPETIYMIYGLDYIGAEACLIDPRVNMERMQYYLNLVNSRMVFITGPYAHVMRKAIKDFSNIQMVNVNPLQSLDGLNGLCLKSLYNLKNAIEKLKEASDNKCNTTNNSIISSEHFYKTNVYNVDIGNPVYYDGKNSLVEFTSGTTGIPKGLELQGSSLNLLVAQLSRLVKSKPGDRLLSIMPPFISYGVACGMHDSFCCGQENIMIPNFSPNMFPELVLKYKPNTIVCVPMFLELLMQSPLVNESTDLSFIRNIIVGGNKTDAHFEIKFNEWLKKHGCKTYITKGGGMAEYSSCLFYTPTKETCVPGIYGIPLPKVDAKIVSADGKELGYYEIGEIHVSSEQGMSGYVNNKRATDNFYYYDEFGKKWGKTGDLGYVDTEGRFTLLNRKKQMVIRPDGHNVFPSEIVNVIKECSYVKDCIVVGIPDENLISGTWPTAFIELKEEYKNDYEEVLVEIIKLCAEKLPLRDRPRECDYYCVNRIINTDEGKINEKATIDKTNLFVKKLTR